MVVVTEGTVEISRMSTRSNPFDEIERFFQRMSQQFDEPLERDGPFDRFTGRYDEMPVDLVERDAEFVVTVDLPGFEKEDVDVRVTDHTLHVEADHKETLDEGNAEYIRHERRHESMRQAIRLPEDVDKENVEARMQNGVLTVTVPKLEVEEARTIEIE